MNIMQTMTPRKGPPSLYALVGVRLITSQLAVFPKRIYKQQPFFANVVRQCIISNSAIANVPQRRSVYTISVDELKELSQEQIDYELMLIKRRMGSSFADQKYEEALGYAKDLESKVDILMGRNNLTYASCLNNVAYAEKLLGNHKRSMEYYTKAIHLYEDIAGSKKTIHYASTLSNIGLLFKAMVEEAIVIASNPEADHGTDEDGKPKRKMAALERLQLLNRAEEALTDAVSIFTEISGTEKRETISATISLAAIWRMQEKYLQAESLLNTLLHMSTTKFTKM